MRGELHKTLTDDDGKMYKLVPPNWLHVITALVLAQLVGIGVLGLIAYSNRIRISHLNDKNEIQRQRNLATDEMLLRRAQVQQWTYEQVCKQIEADGGKCLTDPKWWADRNKYPALASDPDAQGSGLFPRDSQ